jgi:hypothetical protein
LKKSINGRRLGHIIGSVYLVHFARRFKDKQHYLGFSTNVPERVNAHRAGRGTPLLGAVTKKGIPWRVARTWKRKDGYFEQSLKRGHALKDLCPICSGPNAYKKGR